MAITTVRAGQTSYDATTYAAGGTRVLAGVMTDLTEYMDAPDRRDTPFINSITKGKPVMQHKHQWGIKAVNPRGSTVAVAGMGSASAGASSTLPVATGHGARFQQGHVLRITDVTNPYNFEHVWVSADPSGDNLTVIRGVGGTTPRAAVSTDIIRIIGIAMPQLANFPLGPVSRGDLFYNYSQLFETKIEHSLESQNTPSYDLGNDPMDYDAAQKSGDLKIDLEEALISGQRQDGDPNPAAARPSMLSGLIHMAQLAGNTTNVGGGLLSVYHLEDALSNLQLAVGDNAGDKILMSLNGKRIFNRSLNNVREIGGGDTSINLRWDTVKLETGDYSFTHTLRMPDGFIVIYNPEYIQYRPYKGMDWQEKEVPTSGPYNDRAVFGQFTFEMQAPATAWVIYNFSTTLSSYPTF